MRAPPPVAGELGYDHDDQRQEVLLSCGSGDEGAAPLAAIHQAGWANSISTR